MTATYRDALATIQARSDYERGFVSDPFWGDEAARRGLRRMATLLQALDHPDQRYSIIHVAGSKGKGSTCAFAASILTAAGYRVGLTTSPHLHTFRERIVTGGEMISEVEFAPAVEHVAGVASAIEREEPALGRFTAFELLTAMALDHFANARCEVAVVEVGMGGTLDATNVVSPAVSVITSLDYEHTAVLGTTLTEIAANKAGIIKWGRPVVVAAQPPEALTVIEAEAVRNESPLVLAGRDWQVEGDWRRFSVHGPGGQWTGLQSGIAGSHQVGNATLALAAIMAIRDFFPVTSEDVWAGIGAATLPGRFEVVMVDGQTVVLDGAHTPLATAALATTLAEAYPHKPVMLILGAADDKNIAEMVAPLAHVTTTALATAAQSPRAAETSRIARAFLDHHKPVIETHDVAGAVMKAISLAGDENLIVVTGSFNVVAEARQALGLALPDLSV